MNGGRDFTTAFFGADFRPLETAVVFLLTFLVTEAFFDFIAVFIAGFFGFLMTFLPVLVVARLAFFAHMAVFAFITGVRMGMVEGTVSFADDSHTRGNGVQSTKSVDLAQTSRSK